ncbi:MAG: hypothetical protein VKJ46_01570 [Leptolyngbyaceae bacterium]|nr:hypothetical protein [Leptolyngbyaceae bacterium]
MKRFAPLSLIATTLVLGTQLVGTPEAKAHHNAVHTVEQTVVKQAQATAEQAPAASETLPILAVGGIIAVGFAAFFGTHWVGRKS